MGLAVVYLALLCPSSAAQDAARRTRFDVTVNGHLLYTQWRDSYVAIDLDAWAYAWRFDGGRNVVFSKPATVGERVVTWAVSGSAAALIGLSNGRLDWRATGFDALSGSTDPVICRGVVVTGDPTRGLLRAHDAASGRIIWSTGLPGSFLAYPPAIRSQTAVAIAARNGEQAVDIAEVDCATGAISRNASLPWAHASRYPVFLSDDLVILAGYHPHEGVHLQACKLPYQSAVWRLHLPEATIARQRPIQFGDRVVITEDGLWIIDLKTGDVLFHKALPFPGGAGAVTNEVLVVQTAKAALSGIDLKTYRVVWNRASEKEIVSNVAGRGEFVYMRTASELLQLRATTGAFSRRFPLR